MGSNSSASSNTTHHSPHHTTSPPSSSSSLHASTNMLLSPLPSVNRDALLSPPSRVSSAPPASMFTPHHHATPLISPPFHPLYASMYSSAATNTGAIVSPPNNGSSLFSTNSLGNSNSLTSPGVVGGVNGSNSSSGSTSSPSALHSQQQNGKNKTSSALPPASNVQLPPPPNISALPSTSSLYSPLFYGAHNSKLPTYPLAYKFNTPLQPISPYQNPYGMPFMNFSAFYNVNGPMGQTTKKKKKKKNTSNENTAVLNSESVPSSSQELTQQQQVESSGFETDEFLSLEEIEYYNSNVDYNSSSDDHGNTSQKRCLSDTELYFDQGLDSETYNILYPQPTNVPHKNKKQKQEHLNTELNGYYDDLFYDNKDNLEIQETANLTPTNEALNGSSNVVHDISFRVRLYIDSNSSDEKDVVVKDDKTWPEVVRQLISDYQPFYKSFLFDLPSDNFTIILHSKQEEKILSEDSTILASRLSGSDSITITLKQTDHHLCRFNLEVDSITSNGINLNEEDGYDQDNEDDDELEVEESQQDHEDEHNQEEMNCADQMFLNLIESM
nr:unnamed protein product [Naegleria fowleri]